MKIFFEIVVHLYQMLIFGLRKLSNKLKKKKKRETAKKYKFNGMGLFKNQTNCCWI